MTHHASHSPNHIFPPLDTVASQKNNMDLGRLPFRLSHSVRCDEHWPWGHIRAGLPNNDVVPGFGLHPTGFVLRLFFFTYRRPLSVCKECLSRRYMSLASDKVRFFSLLGILLLLVATGRHVARRSHRYEHCWKSTILGLYSEYRGNFLFRLEVRLIAHSLLLSCFSLPQHPSGAMLPVSPRVGAWWGACCSFRPKSLLSHDLADLD